MVAIAETLRQKFETSRQDDAISFLPDIFENRAKISTQNKYYDYAAFGERYAPGTSVSVEQRYTYTGRELNPSGSMFYRYRIYFANIGRFSSRDPIWSLAFTGIIDIHPIKYAREIQNLYQYVDATPIIAIDPFGLNCKRTVALYATGSQSGAFAGWAKKSAGGNNSPFATGPPLLQALM